MVARYVGLISGTSMDGIDAVVVDLSQNHPRLLAGTTRPFADSISTMLDRVRQDPDRFPVADLARLDATLGDEFAAASLEVIQQAGLQVEAIRAIGSHGQTIVHRPEAQPPYTAQIGDAHRIAALTGITTVADFRRADLAAGGQGAPLAPLLHHAMLCSDDETRVVINLGGIANITVLPAAGGVSGFDTGPANCFLDLWYRRHHQGRFDRNGQWASSGRPDETLLGELLNDPYFHAPPPKSTGIEYFSPHWLEQHLPHWARDRPGDIQATLAEFSARSLANAITALPDTTPQRLIVCGGGVHNTDLLQRLGHHLPELPIQSSSTFGLDPDYIEATLFAWLACQRLAGRPLDTAPITGASRPIHCGVVFQP